MQVTPDGDCREAVFSAKGAGLQVPPLSSVQIEYERAVNDWVPLFYGEVRQGGNSRDVQGEDYVLRGLIHRFREVVMPQGFTTPQQPAHLTIRAIVKYIVQTRIVGGTIRLSDIVLPGETPSPGMAIGGLPLIEYDESLCVDLGFDCRPIKDAAGVTVYTLLERIAQDGAGLGVKVAFGVRADRKFFCQPARTDLATPAATDLISVDWKAPIAETPVTTVLWFVAKRPDGRWLTHLSRSGRIDLYGERAIAIPLDPSAVPWVPVPATYSIQNGRFEAGFNNPAVLSDGRFYRDGAPFGIVIAFHPPPGEGGVNADMVVTLNPSGTFGRVVLDGDSLTGSVGLYGAGQAIPLGRMVYGERSFLLDGSGPVTLSLPPVDWANSVGGQVNLAEFRVDRLDTALLDRMAEYHYRYPAQEPADIELKTFRAPGDLAGRIKLSDYERAVEVWEYRLTDARGLTMGVLTGQADDPYKLAQAAMLKRQGNNAVVTAVSATG